MVNKKEAGKKFLIREAVEDDIPVLVEFLAKLALHVSGAPPQSLQEREWDRLHGVLLSSLTDANKHIMVAEVPGTGLVGMGYIYILRNQGIWEQTSHVEYRSAFIDDVWVEPEFRKLGIFPDLLRSLVAFAESRGAYELVLEYSASNKEAKAAWTRLGFKTIGVRAAAFTTAVQEALNNRS
ncbi:GNAT family N-acetyltransferase [Marinobacter panjinensis]|uniref:GNAT family N-acetyltransferase n=1 Tax=Marinobacter panjinensis TaxID=2576384 RepID=A0A4U6R2X7_9GAMM|nr:GNAT family N-acetyltransferase [Marinobacter panjinensis]MCR8913392.1 GNAT family N-acetyltransferase [Marinobacter panjinensis]TKV67940.1 GNAT family N-acetyltransferase [Marinobacter panjinensis]